LGTNYYICDFDGKNLIDVLSNFKARNILNFVVKKSYSDKYNKKNDF
jgi:hypothetical protein